MHERRGDMGYRSPLGIIQAFALLNNMMVRHAIKHYLLFGEWTMNIVTIQKDIQSCGYHLFNECVALIWLGLIKCSLSLWVEKVKIMFIIIMEYYIEGTIWSMCLFLINLHEELW